MQEVSKLLPAGKHSHLSVVVLCVLLVPVYLAKQPC